MSRRRDIDVIMNSEYVSIGELARITGSRYSTLKFYTEEGMLDFHQEDENMTRRYKREESIERLEKIRGMKDSGLSIPQIKSELKNSD